MSSQNALPIADWYNESIKQTAVTIGVTATPLPATALAGRREIWIRNDSGATVYLGNANITAANTGGYPLATANDKPFKLGDQVVLYGIAATEREVLVVEFA